MSKAAMCLAAGIVSAAAVLGGSLAVAVRPDPPSPKYPPIRVAIPQPKQAAGNCSACNLPPVGGCMPAGLSHDCQQCYVDAVNAAGIMPKVFWTTQFARWGYYSPRGEWTEFPACQ